MSKYIEIDKKFWPHPIYLAQKGPRKLVNFGQMLTFWPSLCIFPLTYNTNPYCFDKVNLNFESCDFTMNGSRGWGCSQIKIKFFSSSQPLTFDKKSWDGVANSIEVECKKKFRGHLVCLLAISDNVANKSSSLPPC